jgi:hypothetical protein
MRSCTVVIRKGQRREFVTRWDVHDSDRCVVNQLLDPGFREGVL